MVINLQRAGYTVVDVGCGEDALRVFDEANGDFDIALLDIMMPELMDFRFVRRGARRAIRWGLLCCPQKRRKWIR